MRALYVASAGAIAVICEGCTSKTRRASPFFWASSFKAGGMAENGRAEPSIELGMKLGRGCPARRGREGAQEIRATWVVASSLPHAKIEIPRLELHPELDGWRKGIRRPP